MRQEQLNTPLRAATLDNKHKQILSSNQSTKMGSLGISCPVGLIKVRKRVAILKVVNIICLFCHYDQLVSVLHDGLSLPHL
jgi:hypothetical protein